MSVLVPSVESAAPIRQNFFQPTRVEHLRSLIEAFSLRNVWAAVSKVGIIQDTSLSDTVRNMTAAPVPEEPTPEELLEELMREHLDSVYRVAFSVVRDAALAEDVAQEAILKAWRALPTFRGESSLRSWVLRITHNTAISTLRKRREEIRDPDLLPERVSLTSIESSVEGRLSIDAFEDALGQLDELSRSIVVLREIEGLSYDEIAEMLDVPLPTVKTRLLRSRRLLATALEDWRP